MSNMNTPKVKEFTVTYKDANGVLTKEKPRLMATVNGKHMSLFIGDDIILATVPWDTPMDVLWNLAREKINKAASH